MISRGGAPVSHHCSYRDLSPCTQATAGRFWWCLGRPMQLLKVMYRRVPSTILDDNLTLKVFLKDWSIWPRFVDFNIWREYGTFVPSGTQKDSDNPFIKAFVYLLRLVEAMMREH